MGLREDLKLDVEANEWWKDNKDKVYYEGNHIITEKLPLISDKYDYMVMPDFARTKLLQGDNNYLYEALKEVYLWNKDTNNETRIRIGLTYKEMFLIEKLVIEGLSMKDVKLLLGFSGKSNHNYNSVNKVFKNLLKKVEEELKIFESYSRN